MYADGRQCEALPLQGAEVCIVHGGRATSVQKAAKTRLLATVGYAIDTLERAMECADWPTAVRAALGILDRAGFGPMTKVTVDGVTTTEFKELTNNELQERASMVLRRIQDRKEQLALKQLTVEAVSAERTNENPRPDTPDEDSSNAVH